MTGAAFVLAADLVAAVFALDTTVVPVAAYITNSQLNITPRCWAIGSALTFLAVPLRLAAPVFFSAAFAGALPATTFFFSTTFFSAAVGLGLAAFVFRSAFALSATTFAFLAATALLRAVVGATTGRLGASAVAADLVERAAVGFFVAPGFFTAMGFLAAGPDFLVVAATGFFAAVGLF